MKITSKKKVDITYKGSEIRSNIVIFIEDNAVVVVVGIFPVVNLLCVFVTNQPFNLLTASQKPSRTRKKDTPKFDESQVGFDKVIVAVLLMVGIVTVILVEEVFLIIALAVTTARSIHLASSSPPV